MHGELEIVYQDEDLLVVNKPHGLLVHRTSIAKDADTSVLKILRKQLDIRTFTVHRIDRKTSGALIIALNKKTQESLGQQFREGTVKKEYHAIVRGFTDLAGEIDYAIKDYNGVLKEAYTCYKTLKYFELDLPFGQHQTSRYSLVELHPTTGRYHQLRMHMAHIFHPIIGDRPHGCNKQNKLFKEHFKMMDMMLHALNLEFYHPIKNQRIKVDVDYSQNFKKILTKLTSENIHKQILKP